MVAARLAKLPRSEWHVFHDIAIGTGGANVDHLVVGPAGVFTLNAKRVGGKVWVAGGTFLCNGHQRNYVPAARREADRASRCLTRALGRPVRVRGLVVLVCDELTIKRQPDDVSVVSRRSIDRWLRRQPVLLDRRVAFELATAASDPAIWVRR